MSLIYFSNVRCSFPNLATPFISRKFPNTPPMFTIDIIDMDPSGAGVKEFMSSVMSAAQLAFKEHAPAVMQVVQGDKRARCFGMGPEKINEETFKPLEGYGSGFWINAKNKARPQIIRPNGSVAENEMEAVDLARKIYGGCYVNVALKPWIRTTNRGVSCDLVAVQFFKDGPAFGDGASSDASGLFGAVQQAAGPTASGATMPGFMGGFGAVAAPVPPMPAAPFGAPTLPSFLGG